MVAHAQGTGLDPQKPFGRAQARRAGIPVKHLTSARFRKLFHDVYVRADVAVSPLLRASAVLGISPVGSHASHHTAAQIWGGIVPDQPMSAARAGAVDLSARVSEATGPQAAPTSSPSAA